MAVGEKEKFDTSTGIMKIWDRGHQIKMGHELEGYWTRKGDGALKTNITCCTAGQRGEY